MKVVFWNDLKIHLNIMKSITDKINEDTFNKVFDSLIPSSKIQIMWSVKSLIVEELKIS